MTWNCPAIDHGVTIFPNGKIGPCCQIRGDYLKPIELIRDPSRFADLKAESFAPDACEICIGQEEKGLRSYRDILTQLDNNQPGLQFVDIRNSNQCNLKCRYCGPHFSSQWAKELNVETPTTDFADYKDVLITDSLHWMYFTGGEPLISADHWSLLEELVHKGLSNNIELLYNTNLTTIKYKDKDILDLWKQFKSVQLQCSIDDVTVAGEYIRSGLDIEKFKENLFTIRNDVTVVLTPVISILNIWGLHNLLEFAQVNGFQVRPIILQGPDYLALNVIPDSLTQQAMQCLELAKPYLTENFVNAIRNDIENNINQELFPHTLRHTLLLDKLRKENLFDELPFKQVSIDLTLKNNEYR